jgi:hypothetical protein
MSIRIALAAALACVAAGCGGSSAEKREVRLLAPPGYVEDGSTLPESDWVTPFERRTGCEVDARIYDENEDVVAIARRRDVDAVAGSDEILARLRRAGELLPGSTPHDSVALVDVTLASGVELTVPQDLARALRPVLIRPGGHRTTAWAIRKDGDNHDCARHWIAHAISR